MIKTFYTDANFKGTPDFKETPKTVNVIENGMYAGSDQRITVGDMKKFLINYPDEMKMIVMWEGQIGDINLIKSYTFDGEEMLVFDTDIS